MKDFLKELEKKLFWLITSCAVSVLLAQFIYIIARLFSISAWVVVAAILGGAVLWEIGERLVLWLQLRRMRKKGVKHGRK